MTFFYSLSHFPLLIAGIRTLLGGLEGRWGGHELVQLLGELGCHELHLFLDPASAHTRTRVQRGHWHRGHAHTSALTLLATLAGSVAPSSSARLRFAWFE